MITGRLRAKKKTAPPEAAPALDQRVKRQLRLASGMDFFKHKDPIQHVSESFRQTFELGAKRHLAGQGVGPETLPQREEPGAAAGPQPQILDAFREKTGMDALFQPGPWRQPQEQPFLARFSETALNRGALSGAILRGTGQMMLVSCLKRTVGQSQPVHFRQRKLFESGASARRNVDGQPGAQVVFNRGAVHSAVGLVVDALRDARRVVDTLTELAKGDGALPQGGGAETLETLYPFLSDAKERALLARYKEMLATDGDPGRKRILQSALVKTQAVIARKRQTRAAFMARLRELSDQAQAAALLFEAPGFAEELAHYGTQPQPEADGEPPEPPPDPNTPNPSPRP
jgi:hypothetical protein